MQDCLRPCEDWIQGIHLRTIPSIVTVSAFEGGDAIPLLYIPEGKAMLVCKIWVFTYIGRLFDIRGE